MAKGGGGVAAHPVIHPLVAGQRQQDFGSLLGAAELAEGVGGGAAHPVVHPLVAGQRQQTLRSVAIPHHLRQAAESISPFPRRRSTGNFHQPCHDRLVQVVGYIHPVGQSAGGQVQVAVQDRLVLVRLTCLQHPLHQQRGRFVVFVKTPQQQQDHLLPVGIVQMLLDLLPHGIHSVVDAAVLDVTGGQVLLEGEVGEAEHPLAPLDQQPGAAPR